MTLVANHVILCGHKPVKLPTDIKCCVMIRLITIHNIARESAQSHSPHSSVPRYLVDQADGPGKFNSCFLVANSYIFTITMRIKAPSLSKSYGCREYRR